MRISYIVAILAIVLMVGCAAPQPSAPAAPTTPAAPETPAAPPAPPAVPAAPATAAPAAPAASAATQGEIAVTKAGFNPAQLTVKVGSTITIKAVEGQHKLTIGGAATPTIKEGSSYDAKFDKVGKITIFDIFTKRSAIVTVTQ